MSAVLNLKKSLNKFCIICHLIFYIYYDIIFFETFKSVRKGGAYVGGKIQDNLSRLYFQSRC